MKIGTMPGFTSESSLYKTRSHYRSMAAPNHNPVKGGLVPQIFRGGLGDQADLCAAACICCGIPSPATPECCGACIACGIWTIFGGVAASRPF